MILVPAAARGQTAAVSRIGIVHAVTREGGASVRVAWWHAVLSMAGYETRDLSVLPPARTVWGRGVDHVLPVIRGTTVPETLAWSGRRLAGLVDDAGVHGLVVVTLRAFDDRYVPAGMPIFVDFVDRLSESYRQRAAVDRRPARRVGWNALARAHTRTESWIRDERSWSTAAAGRIDAEVLGAAWFPITTPETDFDDGGDRGQRADMCWDVLFAGTLDYPPNVEAVRVLVEEIMPVVRQDRPGTTLCVAGRRPTSEIRRLTQSPTAELIDGFDDYRELAASTRVAVAPLVHATGLQIKVLDAARARRPQVVTPIVASGFDPEFPLRVAPVGPSFAGEIVRLLGDPAGADALASAAWDHARRCYSTEHWVDEIRRRLDETLGRHPR